MDILCPVPPGEVPEEPPQLQHPDLRLQHLAPRAGRLHGGAPRHLPGQVQLRPAQGVPAKR